MNKAELVKALEERLGSRKEAQEALEVVLDTIVREVAKGGRVAITGFGTFEKAARAARTGRNPRTGEVVKIKKTNVPRFKAGTSFKTYVADPHRHNLKPSFKVQISKRLNLQLNCLKYIVMLLQQHV